ncbi:MAG: RNA methyltransferase, partial [Ginsengibacter sp.]
HIHAMLSKKIVKYIQSLSHKKLRDEQNSFIAEGPKVVREFLLSENFVSVMICATSDWLSENKNILSSISPGNIYEIDEVALEKISQLKTPNKVVCVFEKKLMKMTPHLSNKLSLMLDDIQDPGNLGTIIRIADWFGVDNVICSENSVDCYNPKVVQATMGSLARVNIIYTSLISFVGKNKSVSVYAAALDGVPVSQLKGISEGIIVIGNESKGISDELMNIATQKITIPRYGKAESLNAAVATGIILGSLTPTPSQGEGN